MVNGYVLNNVERFGVREREREREGGRKSESERQRQRQREAEAGEGGGVRSCTFGGERDCQGQS